MTVSTQPLTTTIDGEEYDLTDFMDSHPGGSDMLMLAVGRDASVMFHSYHRRMDLVKARRNKLPKPSSPGPKAPLPAKAKDLGTHPDLESDFYNTVRDRANTYFKRTKQDSRGGLLFKSLVCMSLTALLYTLCMVKGYFLLAPLVGVMFAINGLSIQHDANHGAFSKSPLVNRVFGLVDDLIGGSALMWRHQHVIAHHAHPNDIALDADTFSNFPVMRLNPALPLRSYLRFQHIYGPFLYTLLGIMYPIQDTINFMKGYYEHITLHPLRMVDTVTFVIGKVLHYTLILGIPLYCHGTAAWPAILGLELCGGWFLATVFAVSHNTVGVEYNVPKDTKGWAEMQCVTSCNWSPHSKFWLYASGGLNFQIEHHLFPGVSHVHYPALSEIVKEACGEFGISYNSFPRFRDIYASHIRMLYRLGREENPKFD